MEDLIFQELNDILDNLDEIPTESLHEKLSAYIVRLNEISENATSEDLDRFNNSVYKRFYYEATMADAERYFLMGYFLCRQEKLISAWLDKKYHDKKIAIMMLEDVACVVQYLYDNRVSDEEDIIQNIRTRSRASVNSILDKLVEQGLVLKTLCDKDVFYELTALGYQSYAERNRDEENLSHET